MTMYKIVHIHSDLKFVDGSRIYENSDFQNEIIIFGKKEDYNGLFKNKAIFFSTSKKDVMKVIALCKKADLVILYDLNFIKTIIANKLPASVVILWRFFGYELYRRISGEIDSALTLEIKKRFFSDDSKLEILQILFRKIRQILIWKTLPAKEFDKSLKRINYFIGLSELEYEYLKTHWPYLPLFIQHPFFYLRDSSINSSFGRNKVIIGNNRSAFNNHLDIIQIIQNSFNRHKYEYKIFFNYGPNGAYANEVREKAAAIDEVEIIENFLPLDEFKKLYSQVAALVVNGYRQMAMGNIFEAVINNVKIYLNEKNLMYGWLKDEGFMVFTIEDFAADLKFGGLYLTPEQISQNRKALINIKEKYNKEDFHKLLIEIIEKRMWNERDTLDKGLTEGRINYN